MRRSTCFLEKGTIFTQLLLLYLDLGLVCKNNYRSVQYTPTKCFNNFLQCVVNARRDEYNNSNSTVSPETTKLLVNISYGYQIMDWSRHTVTRYLLDERTNGAINNKMFKRLDYLNDELYEVKLVKSETEHEEPIIVGFFNHTKCKKLRMLEQ